MSNIVRRTIGRVFAIVLTVGLLYLSRFWIWQAPWGNDGLFGFKDLAPSGDVVRRIVRGTNFNEFAVLIWFSGGIAVLSFLQWFSARIRK